MLAYYLHTLSPFIWEITPGFGPSWYGFAYVMAFLVGYLRLSLALGARLLPARPGKSWRFHHLVPPSSASSSAGGWAA